jgi:hypothetical protein
MTTLQDKEAVIPLHRPALRERFFFFSSGIITSVPLTLFINGFADYLLINVPVFYAMLFSIVVFAPFVEEFAKAFPLFYRHGETEKSIFNLGFLVGLGFGVSEFFIYVFELGAPVFARLPLVFFHAATTSITAYGLTQKQPTLFYSVAVFLHFLNNGFAMFDELWFLRGAAVAAAYFLSLHFYNKTSERIVN